MSVIVVGLEQRQSPLELLERVAVTEAELPKALGRLRDRSNLSEVVILSTCLRTEVYAVVERFHEGVDDLQEFLAATSGGPLEALADHFTVRFDDDVTTHLFTVAAGLDSAVLGESEVLGQVRRAWEKAQAEQRLRPGPRSTLPPCRRDRQAGAVRDRHRQGHHLVVPRSGGPGRRTTARGPGRGARPGGGGGGDG